MIFLSLVSVFFFLWIVFIFGLSDGFGGFKIVVFVVFRGCLCSRIAEASLEHNSVLNDVLELEF